jgi:hypothetical protein
MSKRPAGALGKGKLHRDRVTGGTSAMDMVRIRVYNGEGKPMGDMDVPAFSAQVWLSARDETSRELTGIREIVDPDRQNENYDWDIWAKPAEVREDLGVGKPADDSGSGNLLSLA